MIDTTLGLLALLLIAVLVFGEDVLSWTERQASVRVRRSWRALKRKDQS